MTFNLFAKPVEEITQDELQLLLEKEVAEGYFIEYKRDIPAAKVIAKGVSSLANTYGGWFILGVRTNDDNVPVDICGIERAAHGDPLAKVRDAIKAHVDPIPVFHTASVDQGNGRVVLVVHVPDEQDTPFVHSDGRIYRRIHDSSEPVPEANRYALDRLVDQGRRAAETFKRFCRDERIFSESQRETGWLNAYILPYPPGQIEHSEILGGGELRKLLDLSKTPLDLFKGVPESLRLMGNIPFSAGQTGHRSIILRQTTTGMLAFNVLSAEFYCDGRAKLRIPLAPSLRNKITSSKVKGVLQDVLKGGPKGNAGLLRFFDIGELWMIIACLVTYYRKWLGHPDRIDHFRVAATLDNVWRFVPFYDADEWADFVNLLGLPVMNRHSVEIPEGINYGVVIGSADGGADLWGPLCGHVSLALGFPVDTTGHLFVQTLRDVVAKHIPGSGSPRPP